MTAILPSAGPFRPAPAGLQHGGEPPLRGVTSLLQRGVRQCRSPPRPSKAGVLTCLEASGRRPKAAIVFATKLLILNRALIDFDYCRRSRR
jgi:hypothetical protein